MVYEKLVSLLWETQSLCGFSNATNFDVQFEVHSDKKIVTKSAVDVGGGVDVNVAVKGGGGVEAHYKSKEEAKHYLVDPDFKGFTTVNKGTRLDLKDHQSRYAQRFIVS